jgi:hypothetical protein
MRRHKVKAEQNRVQAQSQDELRTGQCQVPGGLRDGPPDGRQGQQPEEGPQQEKTGKAEEGGLMSVEPVKRTETPKIFPTKLVCASEPVRIETRETVVTQIQTKAENGWKFVSFTDIEDGDVIRERPGGTAWIATDSAKRKPDGRWSVTVREYEPRRERVVSVVGAPNGTGKAGGDEEENS